MPPLFRLIQREGRISDDEMYRTFNMGLGFVFAIEASDVAAVRAALPDAIVVGEVIKQAGGQRTVLD